MNSILNELLISLPSATLILEFLTLIIALYFKKYNIFIITILLLISKFISLFAGIYQTNIFISLFLPFTFALLLSLKKEFDGIKCLIPILIIFSVYIILGLRLPENTTFILNSTYQFLGQKFAISDISLIMFIVFFIYLLFLRVFIKFEKIIFIAYFGANFEFLFYLLFEKLDIGFFEFASIYFLISIGIEGYKLAFFDALTQVYNRRAYDRTRLKSGDVIAVCDIDFFKKVNDTYGHDAGDFILKEVAKKLKKNVKKVYRFGGEEFVIIFKNQDFKICVTKLDNIKEQIKSHTFTFNNTDIKITISIGVDLVQTDKIQAFKNADNKLYKAKKQGRDKVIYE